MEESEIWQHLPQDDASIRRRSEMFNQMEPRIKNARYDSNSRRLYFELKGGAIDGTEFSFPVDGSKRLTGKSGLEEFIVDSVGASIRWPDLGVGFSTAQLVKEVFGLMVDPVNVLRSEIMAQLGSTKSEAKSAAARANGAKGGRPRKKPIEVTV